MNYVVLRGFEYGGCSYEKAFSSLEEAKKHIEEKDKDTFLKRIRYWEIWDLNTNTEVDVVD